LHIFKSYAQFVYLLYKNLYKNFNLLKWVEILGVYFYGFHCKTLIL